VVYPLTGLQVPPPEITLDYPLQEILQYSSIQLYLDRVRSILPDFTITPENISSIAEICHQLDGLPLALELASARSNMLTPQQICERLDDRFKFLISKQRSSEESHHQTLSATID
jgi:predicted ATPase